MGEHLRVAPSSGVGAGRRTPRPPGRDVARCSSDAAGEQGDSRSSPRPGRRSVDQAPEASAPPAHSYSVGTPRHQRIDVTTLPRCLAQASDASGTTSLGRGDRASGSMNRQNTTVGRQPVRHPGVAVGEHHRHRAVVARHGLGPVEAHRAAQVVERLELAVPQRHVGAPALGPADPHDQRLVRTEEVRRHAVGGVGGGQRGHPGGRAAGTRAAGGRRTPAARPRRAWPWPRACGCGGRCPSGGWRSPPRRRSARAGRWAPHGAPSTRSIVSPRSAIGGTWASPRPPSSGAP